MYNVPDVIAKAGILVIAAVMVYKADSLQMILHMSQK